MLRTDEKLSERLLTVGEAALRLRQSEATVYRKLSLGQIVGYRLGEAGPYRIPESAVASHLVGTVERRGLESESSADAGPRRLAGRKEAA
jgi:excisionase family DNA binding protein